MGLVVLRMVQLHNLCRDVRFEGLEIGGLV